MYISAWLEHPGSAAHDRRHGRTIAPGIGQAVCAGVQAWMLMLLKRLPHMVGFCASFPEIVFGHRDASHQEWPGSFPALHNSTERIQHAIEGVTLFFTLTQ